MQEQQPHQKRWNMKNYFIFTIMIILFTHSTTTFAQVSEFPKLYTSELESRIERIDGIISRYNSYINNIKGRNEILLWEDRKAILSILSDYNDVTSESTRLKNSLKENNIHIKIINNSIEKLNNIDCNNGDHESEIKSILVDIENYPGGVRRYTKPHIKINNPQLIVRDNIVGAQKEDSNEICKKLKIDINNYFKETIDMQNADIDHTNNNIELIRRSEDKIRNLTSILDRSISEIDEEISKSSSQKTLADKLWIVIIAIGVFSIFTIMAIRLFDQSIQLEWVASGQVIQFVTVMILLSAIMALGLTGILKENVLGTLLGGVAGYVLAQGVGRAAAREVGRSQRRDGDRIGAPTNN
jgi:hypothetical protein